MRLAQTIIHVHDPPKSILMLKEHISKAKKFLFKGCDFEVRYKVTDQFWVLSHIFATKILIKK